MTEVWKRVPISPYRNYEVSDQGSVRRDGRELRGYVDRYGYRTVLLSYAGISKRYKVHRLVCEAFHGAPPNEREVGHLNGSPADNRASNLAWVSRSENTRHQISHGTFKNPTRYGESHHSAKLTAGKVVELRKRHAGGESGRKLAAEIGISQPNMVRLLRGDTWAHVPQGFAQPTASIKGGDRG